MEHLSALHTFYRNKRVLITGHTGFKGGWLAFWLHTLGAEVIGYALPPPTTPNFFEAVKLDQKIISVLGDIRDRAKLKNVFEQHQPEIVFHMAAQPLVRYSYKEPVETYETNVMGTVHVLEACRTTQSVRAIVNITSDKCYENTGKKIGYQEEDKMGGSDPYSSSKGCAELVTRAYLHSYFSPREYAHHRVALASVRAGNVLGGGDWATDRLIPDCIKAMSDKRNIVIRYPDAVRPWQHVLDPLCGYLLLAKHLYENQGQYSGGWNFGPNLEDAKPVRWIVEKLIALWGRDSSWSVDKGNNPPEADFLTLNCTKAQRQLPWRPQWNIEHTLENTIHWYRAFLDHNDMYQYTIDQIHSYEKSCNY